jgi:hypothetical protein
MFFHTVFSTSGDAESAVGLKPNELLGILGVPPFGSRRLSHTSEPKAEGAIPNQISHIIQTAAQFGIGLY